MKAGVPAPPPPALTPLNAMEGSAAASASGLCCLERGRGERRGKQEQPEGRGTLHQVLLSLLEGDPPRCAPHKYSPGLVPSLPWGLAGKLGIRG